MRLTDRIALRAVVVSVAALVAACASTPVDRPGRDAGARPSDVADVSATTDQAFSALEKRHDARVGVFVLDTGSGRSVTWRSGERFAFASTIKAPLAAAVLDLVPSEDLSRVIRFDAGDLVPYSPVTEQHVGTGMTLRAVMDAALRFSDNTAANLLFEEVGGPAGLDRALERLGDRVTRPVRIEPDLNSAVPGEVRDTTTPRAIATTVGAYVLGDTLPASDRDLLRTLMVGSTTGDELIRAGVPDRWVVADKTGSADHGVRNDVAVAFPPGRAAVLIAVMTSRDDVDAPSDDAVVAPATRIAVDALR
ncbi:class A beta-lactamase [Aeromicrobium sp. CFBP 8757]|uniref:class A beta-lactamase n=1 Tax=Aeromicrobium sp. CFBP 8757 TaxID=2775288 RepID=UPI0017813C3C|nr:class A beta-lactamase [Aeromicrobium sp. CFBP 8757]MBD8605511.1 class A beta-lactamase [Aeromicrobium sp. CFBP 8757]